MNRLRRLALLTLLCMAGRVLAQGSPTVSPEVREFIVEDAPRIALTHVRVIDGTGAPAAENQTVVIEGGRIAEIGSSSMVRLPVDTRILKLDGTTVLPGLVGMHNYLWYPAGTTPPIFNALPVSAPRLYLAAGVTTIRTGGSMAPYADLNIKRSIDEGRSPGPAIHLTGPYLEGGRSRYVQMRGLSSPKEAEQMVAYWADLGFTSFKVFMNISRAEMKAAIDEAHRRGLKVLAHPCSVGFKEAVALGVDNIEHGWIFNTDFNPTKKPDLCPPQSETRSALAKLHIDSAPVQEVIRLLVNRKVAITSTLAFLETTVPGRPTPPPEVLELLGLQFRANFLAQRMRLNLEHDPLALTMLKKEMEFERAFVSAGGLLMAGADPAGDGGVLPGFGDLRNIEMLIEAGFTVPEAVRIASANGAQFLGLSAQIGTLANGKQADIVVIRGNPMAQISAIRNVMMVFKRGVAYDAARLISSVKGSVGLH